MFFNLLQDGNIWSILGLKVDGKLADAKFEQLENEELAIAVGIVIDVILAQP